VSMVNQLAYVGAGTADLDAWRIYAGEVLGHQIMPDTDDHALYLRFDDRHHRLVISPAEFDDVSYVGWEVNNRGAMDRAASAISDAGVEILEGSPGEADLRRVLGFTHFACPFSGVRMELAYGHEAMFGPTFQPSRPLSGFHTGEHGLGHVVPPGQLACEAAVPNAGRRDQPRRIAFSVRIGSSPTTTGSPTSVSTRRSEEWSPYAYEADRSIPWICPYARTAAALAAPIIGTSSRPVYRPSRTSGREHSTASALRNAAIGSRQAENEPDIKRHHHGDDRKNADRLGGDQDDHGKTRLVVRHKTKAVLDSGLALFFFFCAGFFPGRQREERGDQGDERNRVREERRGGPPGAD